jgi:uncharacterized protein YbcC (UPF0753/DUF2309 family)
MWNTIKQFLIVNQASIWVSLIVGAIFFILGPLGLWFSGKKVKREKTNKAKSELLDLIESMLVNKEQITISKLLTLFRAIERQNSVNLGLDTDLNNILEDLSLRFAKSKHLSSDQKDAYLKQIDDLISDLETSKKKEQTSDSIIQREIPKSMKSIIEQLREEASNLNSESLTKQIDQLEKQYKRPSDPFYVLSRIIREKPKEFFLAFLIYIIVFAAIMYFIEFRK